MVYIADKNGVTDSAYHTLVRHVKSDIPIVMVSWAENYVFNDALLDLKDYCLICYCEYGYDWKAEETGSHIWGVNSEKFSRYYTGDWIKFDNWVRDNPPKVFFKRELLKGDAGNNIYPIDYTAAIAPIPVQSAQEFNCRPLSAAYYFGRSHEERLRLHARIWDGATRYGYSVADNLYYFNGFMEYEQGKKYASMHIPHYARHPIENILEINGLAKIGIAPFGAGRKTFRASEVSANAVMLMWEDNMAWASEWIHGTNCIKCNPGEEVQTIENWTTYPELYSIYKSGVETWNKYHVKNYLSEYIEPIILKHS